MKICKLEKTECSELNITGITLLTVEEAESLPRDIRQLAHSYWWLRTPGYYSVLEAVVTDFPDEEVLSYGMPVYNDHIAIRPALIFKPGTIRLEIGDKVEVANRVWTVISEDKMLLDGCMGNCEFSKTSLFKFKDANNYENSYVKAEIDKWFSENIENAATEV